MAAAVKEKTRATAGNRWVKTKPGEHFLEGIHLQLDGWTRASSYIPDSRVYDSKPGHDLPRCRLRVKSLIHATTPEAAAAIISQDGMKSTFKRLNDDKGLRLIWWGIALEKKDIATYTEECRTFLRDGVVGEKSIVDDLDLELGSDSDDSHDSSGSITEQLEDLNMDKSDITNRMTNFCSSAPFASTSRYGNIVFEYSIEELLHEYSSQFCNGKDPVFRVMGTFAYKQEVMHAILVCSRRRKFKDVNFPHVDEEATAIFKKEEKWIWSPETTGETMIGNPTQSYRRWEHATFAFLAPEGTAFKLQRIDEHMTYCEASHEKVFRKHTLENGEPWSNDKTRELFDKCKIKYNF